MRLISSDLALKIIVVLRQTRASLAELAQILSVQPSSCQRAIEVLTADNLIAAVGVGRARRYILDEQSRALAAIEELADVTVPNEEALAIVGKANPTVELVGLSPTRLITVFASRNDALEQSRAAKQINRIARAMNRSAEFIAREDLETDLELRDQLRRELARGKVLAGEIDRTIRDPYRRTAGHSLGHISPALRLPPRRRLQSIKNRHRVRQLKIFGSAVRTDFRPESDVDIAVTLEPNVRATQGNLDALELELEKALGRHVDLVLESQLRPPVRHLVEKESVAL